MDEDDEDNAVDAGLRAELDAEQKRLECFTAQYYGMFMPVFASKSEISAADVALEVVVKRG